MDVGALAHSLIHKLKDMTIEYRGNQHMLEENKKKALIGAASVGGAYLIPGEHPVLATIALGYTALKGYQAVRDWAGK